MNKTIKKLNITEILLSLVSIILLETILKPCESGMKCKTFNFIFIGLLGINIIIQVLFLIFKKKGLSILPTFILPIGMLVDKNIVGLCKVTTMRCNTITYPSIVLMIIILSIINILLIILNFKQKRGIDEETD